MNGCRVIVVGGGAAGFFAAITCAESAPDASVTVLEKGPRFLDKVRISGGGRCNVTHACFEARELATRFPRGEQALIGAFQRFQVRDTIEWFARRDVQLQVEADGRMFPVTNSSGTIVDCMLRTARERGVRLRANCGVKSVRRRAGGGFEVTLSADETLESDRLLLATGGCRAPAMGGLATSLGHRLEPPVPSLFSLHIATPWLRSLAGVSHPDVEVTVPDTGLRERGPLLVTHWGLSGPAILRLSAWGARRLHTADYTFSLRVNWVPWLAPEDLATALSAVRSAQGAKLVINAPLAPVPARLWEQLVLAAAIRRETRWATLTRPERQRLTELLSRCEFPVVGKSLNKDEFVTCGGVRLDEVNFKTMESRLCPGLFFAGELLDIDGITGGFNFQAAWTTGWIAGIAMASV